MANKMYKVSTPRPKSDGGTWWARVGTAFTNDKGLITVVLDSYPLPDSEGKVKMMLFDFDDNDRKPEFGSNVQPLRQTQPTRSVREDLDDEIPF